LQHSFLIQQTIVSQHLRTHNQVIDEKHECEEQRRHQPKKFCQACNLVRRSSVGIHDERLDRMFCRVRHGERFCGKYLPSMIAIDQLTADLVTVVSVAQELNQ